MQEDGVTPIAKEYIGVGNFLKDSVQQSYEDEQYIILGVPTMMLQMQSTFASHENVEMIINEQGAQENQITVVNWMFGTLFAIKEGENNGMPYIFNFANISLEDGIVDVANGETITTALQLMNMRLDGNYIITKDIYLDEANFTNEYPEIEWSAWTPIGTIQNPFVGSLRSAISIDSTTGETTFFKIGGLTLDGSTATDDTYGGLFGVTNGTKGGSISNLLMQNVTSGGYKYSGALVGTNGYIITEMVTGNQTVYDGLDISNITLENVQINGTTSVGGLVGQNVNGNISGITISSYTNNDNITTNSTVLITPSANDYMVGGITGYNYKGGVVSRSFVTGDTEVQATVSDDETFIGSVGGLVGKNAGTITSAGLFTSSISVSSTLSGDIGGVAGISTGKVDSVLVKKSTISAGTGEASLSVYVGGIVGSLTGTGSISSSYVEDGTTLEGYYAGGLVGEFTFSKDKHVFNYTFEDNGKIKEDDVNVISIYESAVKDAVILGEIAGGLAGIVRNGIVSDVYAQNVTINGVSESSKLGGVVGEISYSTTSGHIRAGVMQNVYTVASFGGEGSYYAVSSSEFLKDPFITNIPFTDEKFERNAGFITNVVFNDSTDGKAAHPVKSNIFEDWYAQITNWLDFVEDIPMSKSTTEEMQSTTYFNQFNFNSEIWKFESGSYPTIKTIANLETDITTNHIYLTYADTYTIAATPAVLGVQAEGVTFYYSVQVDNGENFSFEIIPNEGITITSAVVSINGVEATAYNGVYTVYHVFTDLNIEIVCTYSA